MTAFSLPTDSGLSLLIDLPKSGVWDFQLLDPRRMNQFATEFDLIISPTIEYVIGSWHDDFSIDLYDNPPFLLAFNHIASAGAFSITKVPEPATLLLLGSGLAGVVVFGRKRLFKKA